MEEEGEAGLIGNGAPITSSEKGPIGDCDSDMEIEDLNQVPRSNGAHEPERLDNDSSTQTVAVAETSKHSETVKTNCVKRPRVMFDEACPSVFVKYNSLTRSSKLKLQELLRQWSEWDAQHGSSARDPDNQLETGEETFFPALHINVEKATSVSFWVDQQTTKQPNDEFTPLDHKSVPLYDRGFVLGLTTDDGTSNVERGLEIVDDAARCFNCGSYSHALKECTKPRDISAVSNARKQHHSKRSQNSASRGQARYYQNSPAGKYDGLRPGTLDAETRKLLGLGELDPPPWHSRMREIGYPPGYLEPDEEDQPSGITIFADDNEFKDDQEDGEIVEADKPEPEKKMSVEFPGINGPIPKDADERLWSGPTPPPQPSLDISRSRLLRRSSSGSSESITRFHHHHHREERWSRLEVRDDDGPPGVDRGFDHPSASTQLPHYSSSYESSFNSHSPRVESQGRFESDRDRDRDRRGHFRDEASFVSSSYLNRQSPMDYGLSSRNRSRVDESREGYDLDHSPHGSSRDRQQDRYRHVSRW